MKGIAATPRPTNNPVSDFTLEASSGESDGDSDYVRSRKNFPARLTNTPEITGHFSELEKMHKVSAVDLREFYQPKEFFTQTDEVKPMDISNNETVPSEKYLEDDDTSLLDIQPSSLYSPLTDASVASESPPLQPHVHVSSATCLASTANLPGVRLMDSDGGMFSVYQDWVHQNTGTHLDGGINKYGKWQARRKKLCLPTQHYDLPSGRVGNCFVSTLTSEIDGIRYWKWNYERVIVFYTIILQHV